MNTNWICKTFEELTVHELYAVLQLRNEVFIIEQNCPYQDLDGKDLSSFHFMGWLDDKLVAYTRIIPPGTAFPEASIGRVVSSPSVRRTGIGRILMQKTIETAYRLFGKTPIRIGAQAYLEKFYTGLGFVSTGYAYLEDNIPHIEMTLTPSS